MKKETSILLHTFLFNFFLIIAKKKQSYIIPSEQQRKREPGLSITINFRFLSIYLPGRKGTLLSSYVTRLSTVSHDDSVN